MRGRLFSVGFVAGISASALGARAPSAQPAAGAKNSLTVASSAFRNNELIPPEYTCDGPERPPPLSWSGVPGATKTVAILVDDPDAPSGMFTHWLVSGIPPTTTSLPAGGALPPGAVAGRNSKGLTGYAGPCPASGRHRYHFRVFALDTAIAAPASTAAFLSAIDGHLLAIGELVGTYQRLTTP